MHLRWWEVLDDRDLDRVQNMYVEAVERSADHLLVGFRVRGPVVRIVWAVSERLGPGVDKDLPPDLASFRFDGLWFSEGPTADLELDEAKPPN
jgi:hypothetical protein